MSKQERQLANYIVSINGKVSNRECESALYNVIFSCLRDDEIRYAKEWAEYNMKNVKVVDQ